MNDQSHEAAWAELISALANLVIGFEIENAQHSLRKWPGAQYKVLTLGEYFRRVTNPTRSPVGADGGQNEHQAAKDSQRALIPSDYRGHDARSKIAQEANNAHYLCIVIDDDGGTVDPLAAVLEVLGDVSRLGHNTYSDGAPGKGQRNRVLIPLDPTATIAVHQYPFIAAAIGEALNARGVSVDPSAERVTQIAYHGMLGPWAAGPRVAFHGCKLLNLHEHPAIIERARELAYAASKADMARGKNSKRLYSPIWHANRNLGDPMTLAERYGWKMEADGKWQAPGQSSKGSAVFFEDGGWNTFSQTVGDWQVGTRAQNGTVSGDALDLWTQHELIERRKMAPLAAKDVAALAALAAIYGYDLPVMSPDAIDPGAYLRIFEDDGRKLFEGMTHVGGQEIIKRRTDGCLVIEPLSPSELERRQLIENPDPLFEFAEYSGQYEGVKYLLDPFLPLKRVIGFYGRGGAAKSTLLSTMAAKLSIASFNGAPASTLWITSEEDTDFVYSRFHETNGLLNNLVVLSYRPKLVGSKEYGTFSVQEHLEKVVVDAIKELERRGAATLRLIVMDAIKTLMAWGKGESGNSEEPVKKVIAYMQSVAERYNVSFAIIGHMNKGTARIHGADAVAGSAAWMTSIRLGYLLYADDASEENFHYIMETGKFNVTSPHAITYKTVPIRVIHERQPSADPDNPDDFMGDAPASDVACKTEWTSKIAWGTKVIRQTFDDSNEDDPTHKAKQSRKINLQAKATAVKEIIKDERRPCIRSEIEIALKSRDIVIATRDWTEIDKILQSMSVIIVKEAHNKSVYSLS